MKRFWSGQFTPAQVAEACQRRGTEQILLKPERTAPEWKALLANYDAVFKDTNYVLYVENELKIKSF